MSNSKLCKCTHQMSDHQESRRLVDGIERRFHTYCTVPECMCEAYKEKKLR